MPSFLGRGDFFAHYCVLSADEVGWEVSDVVQMYVRGFLE
jgi:hypothetical protein